MFFEKEKVREEVREGERKRDRKSQLLVPLPHVLKCPSTYQIVVSFREEVEGYRWLLNYYSSITRRIWGTPPLPWILKPLGCYLHLLYTYFCCVLEVNLYEHTSSNSSHTDRIFEENSLYKYNNNCHTT